MPESMPVASDRRRLDRPTNPTLAELTLPELRRGMITPMLIGLLEAILGTIMSGPRPAVVRRRDYRSQMSRTPQPAR